MQKYKITLAKINPIRLTLSYTAIIEIATFTAVDENGRCNNNGIEEQLPHTITDLVIIR